MRQRRKPDVTRENTTDQQMRDQEVLRASRELAAYFKGRRTEREARAALKTIKAFVRDRERRGAKSRPPLPGGPAAKTPNEVTNRKAATAGGERHRRKPGRKSHDTSSKGVTRSIEPQVKPESPEETRSND